MKIKFKLYIIINENNNKDNNENEVNNYLEQKLL